MSSFCNRIAKIYNIRKQKKFSTIYYIKTLLSNSYKLNTASYTNVIRFVFTNFVYLCRKLDVSGHCKETP